MGEELKGQLILDKLLQAELYRTRTIILDQREVALPLRLLAVRARDPLIVLGPRGPSYPGRRLAARPAVCRPTSARTPTHFPLRSE